ncbi:bifunctional 2-polyprenyl-6-hydroxyphenol methylase/3-demethylubiquinol 3-O-methyltransferase UbiG [Selenomonas sp. F0473]|uniref:class I SAM-dependent methyltransferase n=1 Tax=Selenomonas sp. F0473 TaxID=999423 RepID=UPI00029E761C|nr:class I SAM-dependent methyltransferase [Selenomonas sp. F0473]EKU71240.1 hypothetical protein HMPREF9161_01334 [Selenomonas sp. F0473]
MENQWRAIWNRRVASDELLAGGWQDVFLRLKALNGFDVVDGGIPLSSLLAQYERTKELLLLSAGQSVFEVGCGAGANLYLFARDGIAVGGTDYAAPLIDAARRMLPGARELSCGEADTFDTSQKYNAALANSVFSYFPDEDFAARALIRMCEKTRGAIGLIDLHDIEKKQAFHDYRVATVPNYEERYKGLDKLFYSHTFFEDFARRHGLRVEFPAIEMNGYWNTPFVFHCFMYRK